MPATLTKFYGSRNEAMYNTGGGQIFLIKPNTWDPTVPPAIKAQGRKAVNHFLKESLSQMVWTDADCTEFREGIVPWCILEGAGLKVSMKQGRVEFKPNDGPPKNMLTGSYEEATATGSALDIACSPSHYMDLMGTPDVVDFYAKATADREELGTEMVSIGPTKMQQRAIIIFRDMGHPQIEGRYTVRYFCGELSVDFEGEFSISNALKAEIKIELQPIPNITQPNGGPVYQIIETPVMKRSNPPTAPVTGDDGDDG
jgi:hypothetical protein